MRLLLKFLTVAVLFFAAYVQSESTTSPMFLKYWMWFCCGAVFMDFIKSFIGKEHEQKNIKE